MVWTLPFVGVEAALVYVNELRANVEVDYFGCQRKFTRKTILR